MTKEEIIESVLALAPGKADAKLLSGKSRDELLIILEDAVVAFQERNREKIVAERIEREAQHLVHQHYMEKVRAPQREAEAKALEKKNQAVFLDAARRLKFSACQANLRLLTDLDPELNFYRISSLVMAGIALAKPSAEELQEWQRLDVEEHNTRLLNADPVELKRINQSEVEERRRLAQQAEIQRRITEQEKRDQAIGFSPLPTHNAEGQAIDRAYLLRLADMDMKRYRSFLQKYGSANITARLNGVR